jgi:cellulose biosynthesis protein BcsQ
MIISIANGTGGAGKTTSLTNLAVAQKEPVSLLDCDVKGYHFMGYLPYMRAFILTQVEGKTILGYDSNNQIKQVLAGLWKKLRQEIHRLNPPEPSKATVRAARP